MLIPIASIFPHPDNPRSAQDDAELAESLERDHNIPLYPLLVREYGKETYQVIDGHRRLAVLNAKQLVGNVDCKVIHCDDEHANYLLLEANLHGKRLEPVEEARAIAKRMQKFGKTQAQIAKEYGKSQGWVSQRLALLPVEQKPSNPERGGRPVTNTPVQEVTTRVISESRPTVAREVRRAPEPAQRAIAETVVEKQLTTRQTEDLVEAVKAAPPKRQAEVAQIAAQSSNPVATAQTLSRSLQQADPEPEKPLKAMPVDPFFGSMMEDVVKKTLTFTGFWATVGMSEECGRKQPHHAASKLAVTYQIVPDADLLSFVRSLSNMLPELQRHLSMAVTEQQRRAGVGNANVIQLRRNAS